MFIHLSHTSYIIITAVCKKVISNSPGLVDFVMHLMNSVLNLHNRQLKFFRENLNYRSTVRQIICLATLLQFEFKQLQHKFLINSCR